MVLFGVIMAGGSGTRFWPYSRTNRPKQLLSLFSKKSMMQETIDRLKKLMPTENIFISTNKDLAGLMKKDIPDVQPMNYIVEPIPKDTAACIGLSAMTLCEKDQNAIMFIETSDHIYKDEDAYIDTIRKAVVTASTGKIVLVGIEPSSPHTGYGYIHLGDPIDPDVPSTCFVQEFREKPDLKTAKEYLESKEFVWNSGMFIAKCSVMLEEIERQMPELYDGLMKIKQSGFDDATALEVFERLEKISVDFGVMEKSDNTVVVRSNMPWDDIGDFTALERSLPKDERKNVGRHEGNCSRCIIMSQTRKVIANNVSDLIIVDTPDATLICDRNETGNLKKVIQKIRDVDLGQYLEGYVKEYSRAIVAHESDDCEVDTDGMMVMIGVAELEIKRDNDTLTIEGIENEVDVDAD